MISVQDKKRIEKILSGLSTDQVPVHGKMTAQHMIEHLILIIKISVNKIPQKIYTKPENLPVLIKFLYSDKEIMPGIKAPGLPDDPIPLKFTDFGSALEALLNSIDEFHYYYNYNPSAKAIHPVFGELNYQEWIMFHNKHFTYHFKQFGLV
jgi:hydroxymethylglutaryl-CoA reductase